MERSLFTSHGVSETHFYTDQVQGLRGILGLQRQNLRVVLVAQDGKAQLTQVQPQLMSASGDGFQLPQRNVTTVGSEAVGVRRHVDKRNVLDDGVGVWLALESISLHLASNLVLSRAQLQRGLGQGFAGRASDGCGRCQRVIALSDFPRCEKPLVGTANFAPGGKDEQPRRQSVEAMRGNQLRISQLPPQAYDSGFRDVSAAWHRCQKRRLVDDHKVVILKDNRHRPRDCALRCRGAVKPHFRAGLHHVIRTVRH